MKTFLIGFFSLSVHSAKRGGTHGQSGIVGTHTGGFSTTAGVQGDVRFRVYGYTSIELIDCDGVLSAGFARHLAHRQRSIQTDDSSLDYILFHSLLLLAGLRRKRGSDSPLGIARVHRLCGERYDALCVQFRFPLIPASRGKNGSHSIDPTTIINASTSKYPFSNGLFVA